MDVKLAPTHRLAPLLQGGRKEYMGNLSLLLGKPIYELDSLCKENKMRIGVSDNNIRLMFYFLLESYYECEDMGGSWHMARNKLRALKDKRAKGQIGG